MNNEDTLVGNYMRDIILLKQEAASQNLSENEIENSLQQSYTVLEKPVKLCQWLRILKRLLCIITLLSISCIILYIHQPTTSLILRNVQGLIYPGFKLVRYISMPIITLFPALTRLYDETCLLENSYFQVSNLDCWPCQNVHSVINLTGLNSNSLHETGTPFITTETGRQMVPFESLVQFYKNHSQVLKHDAGTLHANVPFLKEIADLISFDPSDIDFHISWHINRMLPVRYIRKLFPRPNLISEWSGQSIERYIFIDSAKSGPYKLPAFECPYVFFIQASGQRTVRLNPTKECQSKCKSVSVLLQSSDILWYNWWYWKPLSLLSENTTNISVSYINSYC